jgi:hypothetical protein
MKHTREQLDGMSKQEINKLIAKLTAKKYSTWSEAVDYAVIDGLQFDFEKWQDIMPMAFEYGICVYAKNKMAWVETIESCGDVLFDHVIESASPQRAIACCLIMVLESSND